VDDIVGVIYARDILAYLDERAPDTLVQDLMRPVHYVPETKKIDELLADFRRQRTHIAIVLDEYGGTAGIVTIEDLLEEIVGEIQDEYDAEELAVRPIDDQTFEVDGGMQLEELNELLEVDLPHEDFDTVGGLILHLLGRAPVEGEQVALDGLEFSVAKVVGRRVKRVIVHRGGDVAVPENGRQAE
jgi:CBS domain containing-hemolysin-like protein